MEEPLLAAGTGEQRGGQAAPWRLLQALARPFSGAAVVEVDEDVFSTAASAWGKSLRELADGPEPLPAFDVTRWRTERLYNVIVGSGADGAAPGPDNHGPGTSSGSGSPTRRRMGLEAFRAALEAERFQIQGPKSEELLQAIFKELAGGEKWLDVRAFHTGLQQLKLRLLLLPGVGHTPHGHVQGWCIDWSPGELSRNTITSSSLRRHLLEERGAQYTMRWSHFENPDAGTLLKLGVRYQLHLRPLQYYKSDQVESRLWVHGEDYHLLLTAVRLSRASKSVLNAFKEESRQLLQQYDGQPLSFNTRVTVEVEQAQLYLYMSGRCETVLTTLSDWRGTLTARCSLNGPRVCQLRRDEDQRSLAFHRSSSLGVTREGSILMDVDVLDFCDKVTQTLEVPYCELRMTNATGLTWGILSCVVEDFVLVNEAHRARLRWFESHLDQHSDAELMRTKRDLEHLQRKLHPLAQLVGRLMRLDCFETEVKFHMEGVADTLTQLLGRVAHNIELCVGLRSEVRAQKDARESDSRFHITAMVTLLFPLQFLTGVYGMNFQDDSGHGVVPLLGQLSLERSYILFWGLGVGMTMLLAVWFRYAKLL